MLEKMILKRSNNLRIENKVIIISVIVLSLAISGCGNEGNEFYDPYYGTGGLYVEFIDGAPPDFVYEMQEFPVGIFIKNEGAYDINDGVIAISVEDDYVSRSFGDSESILLKGRSQYSHEGEEQTKMFYFDAKKLDSLSQMHNSEIIVSLCYQYNTKLQTNVCIDPDVFNLKEGEKPCTVEPMSFSGQGAPVAVTYIEENIARDPDNPGVIYPTFEITIENLGYGDVIDQLSVDRFCGSSSINSEEFNLIDVTAYISADEKLSCYPVPVRIRSDGLGKVVCRSEGGIESSETSRSTLLDIRLAYGYTMSMSRDFTIQKTMR
jgi:hypothetical protein